MLLKVSSVRFRLRINKLEAKLKKREIDLQRISRNSCRDYFNLLFLIQMNYTKKN